MEIVTLHPFAGNHIDTGGYNMWMAHLGNQLICYQNNSIYSLNHIGDTNVFDIRLEMPDLGLLAPHLVYSKRNVHYFLGNDYNLYRYYGGANTEIISRGIQRYIERDLNTAHQDRCWIAMGAENSRLWLFIVPNGSDFITQAYGIDMVTGKWMKRDYLHKWPTGGITSVALIGASTSESGQSYAELLATTQTYAQLVVAGTTYRQLVQTTLTKERLALGDNSGNVYQYDSDVTQDDGVDVPTAHITEVLDGGFPGKSKLWPGVTVTAKGTSLEVSYRTGNFETVDTGWISLNQIEWFGITSANLDSLSGEEGGSLLSDALDGTNYWGRAFDEQHWFVIDLGTNYKITKVRGRSNSSGFDPDDVSIFVSETNGNWGTAVASGITTWQVTSDWVEVSTTEKVGRYIRIQTQTTPHFRNYLSWGDSSSPFTIFDVYTGTGNNLTSEFVDYFLVINDTSKKIQFKFHHTADDWSVSNYVIKEPQLQGEI